MIIRIKDDKKNAKITKKTIWWNHKSAKDIFEDIWNHLKALTSPCLLNILASDEYLPISG